MESIELQSLPYLVDKRNFSTESLFQCRVKGTARNKNEIFRSSHKYSFSPRWGRGCSILDKETDRRIEENITR
jgi:hypothetical protein